ncbi:MAG: hypothetical protein ACM3SY_07405 [Candidatus Omnitrophota bacterium]
MKMKKLSIVIIMLILSLPLVCQQSEDVILSLIRKLEAPLQLSAEQSARIKAIMAASEAQMVRDRRMFANNEPALIQIAQRRRDMTETHIESVLNAEQLKKYPAVKDMIHLDDDVITVMETLAMSYSQAYRMAEIMAIEKDQAKRDRETYQQSASALISAARARKEMTNVRIQEFLTPEQKQRYRIFKQNSDNDNEFFLLKEGLILDREQSVKVKRVLEGFRQVQSEMKGQKGQSDRDRSMGSGGGFGGGGDMRGGMPGMGGGMHGGMHDRGGGEMSGGMGGGMKGRGEDGNPMMEKMKELEAQKLKSIREILHPDQLERYNQILQSRAEDREKRFKEFKPGSNPE